MKTCFKCHETKPIAEFYAHPRMADGTLNKCKQCTKHDVRIREAIKKKDLAWVESELERHREKSRRYRAQGKHSSPKLRDAIQRYFKKHPEKRKAHNKVQNAVRSGRLCKMPCTVCGDMKSEAHHEDYSKPLDVVWLCSKHHNERHVQIRKQQRYIEATVNALTQT